ncbi:ammonium transporter Rh type B-like [Paramuricea clavata]|uniref:Ammonium transporter Rh type B-like n=1 Tax=Paramuricea clavata TaxID=317549 RepID=A0A6S7HG77_PARCT|nr:ammonium transporter Rh type B-like [Paramuricea clavata]
MIFLGIGYLIIFLKRYGYSSVGYNFFLGAISIQWYIIVAGCLSHRGTTGFDIDINIKSLITGLFAAAVVLISFGVYMGKVSRIQLLVIMVIEIVMYAVNEFIVLEELQVADIGGSMIVHMFACYFGMAVTFVLRRPEDTNNNPKEAPVYHSDLFAMIGSLFLWLYWPSFNSILVAPGNDKQRAVINTYLSLTACTVSVFATSAFVNKEKLQMAHVQNAVLAGGVAVGTTANMLIQPWGAILLGTLAGIISVCGFYYVQPYLNEKLKLHDTCGVHNLHGMPGLLGALAGVVAAKLADVDDYKDSLEQTFEAAKDGRSSSKQAGYQTVAILITLGISIASGAIAGFIVKLKIFDSPTPQQLFDDQDFWELPDGCMQPRDVENVDPSGIALQSVSKVESA